MAIFSFEEFVFDDRKGILMHLNEPMDFRPQSAQLLKLLLENSDRIVTKNEIITQIWDGEFINDQVLFQCMNDLRKALGETAKEPRFIRTIPRKGYRWIFRETTLLQTKKMARLPSIAQLDQPTDSHNSPVAHNSPVLSRLPLITGAFFFLLASIFWFYSQRHEENTTVLIGVFENHTGDKEVQWLEKELQWMLVEELNTVLPRRKDGKPLVIKSVPVALSLNASEIPSLFDEHHAQFFFATQIREHDSEVRLLYQYDSKDGKTKTGLIRGLSLGETIHRYATKVKSLLGETQRVVVPIERKLNEPYTKGIGFLQSGDYERAHKYFNACVDEDPDFMMGVIKLARCKFSMGHYEKAKTLINGCLERKYLSEEERARCQFLLGELNIQANTLPQAQGYLERALHTFKNLGLVDMEGQCYTLLAQIYTLRKRDSDVVPPERQQKDVFLTLE